VPADHSWERVLTVAYVRQSGTQPLPAQLHQQNHRHVTCNPTTGVASAVREFGNRFAEIDYKTSGGTDNYNSMQVT
jgi:hypothetical protein